MSVATRRLINKLNVQLIYIIELFPLKICRFGNTEKSMESKFVKVQYPILKLLMSRK